MSLTKSEVIEKNRYELQFSVDKATFDEAVTKVFRQKAKNINVPGFRKGKAPRAIIEKMYGAGIFYEDAINDLIPEAYSENPLSTESDATIVESVIVEQAPNSPICGIPESRTL